MPFYLTPEQDDFNQELQVCIAETLYDVDSIVADPEAGYRIRRDPGKNKPAFNKNVVTE